MRKLIYYGKRKGIKDKPDTELKLLDGYNYVSWKDGVKK